MCSIFLSSTKIIQSITEAIVGEMKMKIYMHDDDGPESEFADRLNTVFADKPDNCTKITDEDFTLLIKHEQADLPNLPEQYIANEERRKNQLSQMIDTNGDGDLSCSGKIRTDYV